MVTILRIVTLELYILTIVDILSSGFIYIYTQSIYKNIHKNIK